VQAEPAALPQVCDDVLRMPFSGGVSYLCVRGPLSLTHVREFRRLLRPAPAFVHRTVSLHLVTV